MRILLSAAFLLLPLACTRAGPSAIPEGGGIMYGGGYAFTLVTPKGWILDNTVAQDTGACAVYYPVGSSWKDSPVVFYVNTREITPAIHTAADVARDDVETYHRHGSPNSKVAKVEDLKAAHGKTASIWEYTGDQWGNCERSAFFVEPNIINVMVLSARTRPEMERALPAFASLVGSYEFLGKFEIKN